MKKQFYPGLTKILFSLQKARDSLDISTPAGVMFGPTPETAAGERGRDLVLGKTKWARSKQSLSNTDVKRRVQRVCYVGKGKRWILQSSVQLPAC
jgi:hypothetical protein